MAHRARCRWSARGTSIGIGIGIGLLLLTPLALAQADPGVGADASTETGAARLAPVVVTATRTEAAPFDIPASIDSIDGDTLRDGRLKIDIAEGLRGVPGVLARDRQNYAQDVQVSVRGFGARSTFGIRGVRLYVDGIPATLPDGQGQITHVDLGSVDRIEVLRGPFSALYGNSSGGVISVFTEEGRGPPTASLSLDGGSFGTLRVGAKASGSSGSFGWLLSASEFGSDGYREHSAAERRLFNAKLTWQPAASSKLTLVVNSVALPKAQDPLGLTRAQAAADPRSAVAAATLFDTRKSVDQTQLGVVWDQRIDASNALRLLLYGGHRNTEQFQSIPVAVQAGPLQPGGVISLGRDYSGADLRWTSTLRIDGRPLSVVAGLAYDRLDEQRRGFQNFVSGPSGNMLGVQGALRRDERNEVSNLDPYVQASWRFAERWTLDAGVRHSSVRFASDDRYVTTANPDDSGSVRYAATLPVAGLLFAASEDVHLYATAGRGFETPTLNELAYRPNGLSGLNLGLRAARSDSIEAGLKTREGRFGALGLAVFATRTRDEIVTQTNSGGRSTYQNAGATRRRGLEAAWSANLTTNLRAEVAYTRLDARYSEAFATCSAAPCTTPTSTIPSGNRIPGVAGSSLYGRLAWNPLRGWRGSVEAQALSRVFVDDANSDAAAGFARLNAHVGYRLLSGRWDVTGFARVDNLLDRRTIGSVIVGESNGRFFEPAPGRSWGAGITAAARF